METEKPGEQSSETGWLVRLIAASHRSSEYMSARSTGFHALANSLSLSLSLLSIEISRPIRKGPPDHTAA